MTSTLPLSYLVSAIAHELRSPLASVKGNTTILLDYQDRLTPDRMATFLDAIDRETDRLTEMLDDLIALARSQIGALRLQRQVLPLTEVLEPLLVGRECRFVGQGIDVALPAALVNVDVRRLRRALTYLVQHQRTAGPTETFALFVAVNAQRVLLRLPAAEALAALDRSVLLLEQSEQLGDPALRRSVPVMLQLLFSQTVVELHGGQWWFEDQAGVTSLCMALPCVASSEVE